eukprot:109407_1
MNTLFLIGLVAITSCFDAVTADVEMMTSCQSTYRPLIIIDFSIQPNAQQCRARCCDNPDCEVVSFLTVEGVGQCRLRMEDTSGGGPPGGVEGDDPDVMVFNIKPDGDLPNLDSLPPDNPSLGGCSWNFYLNDFGPAMISPDNEAQCAKTCCDSDDCSGYAIVDDACFVGSSSLNAFDAIVYLKQTSPDP